MGLQELFIDSDIRYDPQALILAPVNVIEISKEIVKGSTYVEACVLGYLKALDIIEGEVRENRLKANTMEDVWYETLRTDIESIPFDESKFVEAILPTIDRNKIILSEYGL